MDFFSSQDRARRRTTLLVGYFAVAVLLIIAAVYLLVAVIFLRPESGAAPDLAWIWRPGPLAWVTAVTSGIIGCGSLYRIVQLAGGGSAVAAALGGVPLPSNPSDPGHRRLRNVVEEMALASGIPVPNIYVLPAEDGINAFAAGFTPKDASIGVTQGSLHHLNRDELQGVIAHEFSHILNGDIRLNLRLMGVLYGILCLAIIGRILLRTRGRKNPLPLLGLGLLAIGSIGVFFGRLIKSAVSRQREFLADAAAVQFTRHPEGIANALRKIGGLTHGSQLQTPNAEEASHFFFCNGLTETWNRLFATHPPLADRIRAIDPSFDGRFTEVTASPTPLDQEQPLLRDLSPRPPTPPHAIPRSHPLTLTPEALVRTTGQTPPDLVRHAGAWRDALPHTLRAALEHPAAASAVFCALLLATDPTLRARQLAALDPLLPAATLEKLQELLPVVANQPEAARLPLADLTLLALRDLPRAEYEAFRNAVRVVTELDAQIDLREYALLKVLCRHLDARFERPRPPVVQFYVLKPVAGECARLLSALAHVGARQPSEAQDAFRRGAQQLQLPAAAVAFLPPEGCGLGDIDTALDRLNQITPSLKRNVLLACAHTVAHDQCVSPQEAQLIRAIADALDCPIPPLVTVASPIAPVPGERQPPRKHT